MNTASIAALRDAVEVPGTAPGQAYRRVVDALERFGCEGRERNGRGHFRCPAHEHRAPSLSVRDAGDRVLLHCFAGCAPGMVANTLGLDLADLFDEGAAPRRRPRRDRARTRPSRTRRPTTDVDALLGDLRAAGLGYVPLERRDDRLGWWAECPYCRAWSLLFYEYEDTQFVLWCAAGCEREQIVTTLLRAAA